MKMTIAKNKANFFGLLIIVMFFNSCYFPNYRSIAESSLYDINFSEGKWFLNHVTVNGKAWNDLSTLTEEALATCLKDSLYLSYGKRKAAYIVPVLNDKNAKEQLNLLKATNSVDYVIQVVGNISADEIGVINIKPHKFNEKSEASISVQVYDVQKGKLIYSHKTTGTIDSENNNKDVVFGKSIQTILTKCLEKELKTLKKNSGCEL
ncbi:MAG TPA: hypothetical protein PLL09_02640 [Flavobacterium sp.]|uniref:hypothetical protein n=1 Tax=unclassified Flavobacterium TaxID=196869 RepID=UPI0025C661DA|nr:MULTISPECIES: hypothetical protein [unclassified Flavobacterium]HRE76703.1 hypothetical protein [Flavobacterium sp.]